MKYNNLLTKKKKEDIDQALQGFAGRKLVFKPTKAQRGSALFSTLLARISVPISLKALGPGLRVRPARLTQSTTTTSNNTITIPLGEGLRNRPYSVDQFIPLSLPPFIASWSNTKGKGVAKKKKKKEKCKKGKISILGLPQNKTWNSVPLIGDLILKKKEIR